MEEEEAGEIESAELELRMARLEHLMDRRPLLLSSVLLRQNPHNVEEWHKRVALFAGSAGQMIRTFSDAVRTVDPLQAIGKPHTLWLKFAALYEQAGPSASACPSFVAVCAVCVRVYVCVCVCVCFPQMLCLRFVSLYRRHGASANCF